MDNLLHSSMSPGSDSRMVQLHDLFADDDLFFSNCFKNKSSSFYAKETSC